MIITLDAEKKNYLITTWVVLTGKILEYYDITFRTQCKVYIYSRLAYLPNLGHLIDYIVSRE